MVKRWLLSRTLSERVKSGMEQRVCGQMKEEIGKTEVLDMSYHPKEVGTGIKGKK